VPLKTTRAYVICNWALARFSWVLMPSRTGVPSILRFYLHPACRFSNPEPCRTEWRHVLLRGGALVNPFRSHDLYQHHSTGSLTSDFIRRSKAPSKYIYCRSHGRHCRPRGCNIQRVPSKSPPHHVLEPCESSGWWKAQYQTHMRPEITVL
jgi:hypothetical protein